MPYRFGRVLLLFPVCLLLATCRGLPAASPMAPATPAPTLSTAGPAETAATHTAVPQTVTPPSAVPHSGPHPPAVLDYDPGPGGVVGHDGLLSWQFTEAMDRQSLSDGFRVTPDVTGELVWLDDQTVTFRSVGLVPGIRYSVDLGDDLKSADGLPLSGSGIFPFFALAPLQVVDVSPVKGQTEVRADAPIRVTFDRPVVSPACVNVSTDSQPDCPQLRLHTVPQGIGEGVWVHSTVYQFEMQAGLAAGSAYAVTVDAGLESVDGGTLAGPVTWSFETASPRIVEMWPTSGHVDVPLEAGVHITFNTPMDQAFTGGAFSIAPDDGVPVAGTLTWEDNGAALVFVPAEPLALGTTYHARLGERARAESSAPLENPQTWGFRTVPYPRLIALTPGNGDRNVGVDAPLRLAFEGAIDEETLAGGVEISPAIGIARPYGVFDAISGVYSLGWEQEPQTRYCVTLKGAVDAGGEAAAESDHRITDVYGNPLVSQQPACFTTGDLAAEFSLVQQSDGGATLDAARQAQFHFVVRNADRADFVLAEIGATALMQQKYAEGEVQRQWRESFDTDLNVATVVTVPLRRSGGALPTGLYSLSWQVPTSSDLDHAVAFAVVDMHLTAKLSAQEGLVWVTALSSGMPVSKVAVQLLDQEGLLVAGGTTDDDGLAYLPLTNSGGLSRAVAAVVGQPGAPGFGFALVSWHGRGSSGDLRPPESSAPVPPQRAFVQADRALYEPGDRVRIAGWLRERAGQRFGLPDAAATVVLQLRDPSWQLVYSSTHQIGETGEFAASLVLPERASLGSYVLEVVSSAPFPGYGAVTTLATADLVVARRDDPGASLTVTPVSSSVLVGETVRYVIAVSSASDGGVADTEVTWRVLAEDVAVPEAIPVASGVGWSWGGSLAETRHRVVQETVARTDAEGRILVELPADLADLGGGAIEGPQRWTLEATYLDDHAGPVTVSDDVIVHETNLYLGIRPSPRVAYARERVTVDLLAVGRDGAPSGGRELTVKLVRRKWQPPAAAGATWNFSDTIVTEQTATTTADGRGSTGFTIAQSGSYLIVVEGVDSGNRRVRSEAELWVGGGEAVTWRSDTLDLTLLADAMSCSACAGAVYRPGDVARVLVPTTFEGPYEILLTLERESILAVKRYSFATSNPILEVPITEAYAPNVYVSVAVVHPSTELQPAQVQLGYLDLQVDTDQHRLSVIVTPDKAVYEPGDVANLRIRTLDAAGSPVSADVLLSRVDSTSTVSLRDAFYGSEPLRVLTGDTLLVAMDRSGEMLADLMGRAPAVGDVTPVTGTGELRNGTPGIATHRAGPGEAFWTGRFRTGIQGEVEVSIDLPDVLATWHLMVRALSEQTQVGEAEVALPVVQSLHVQPAVPRFVVAGDRTELAAVVYNATPDDLATDVWIEPGHGLVLVSAENQQRLVVPAATWRRVTWTVDVAGDVGSVAHVSFGATTGAHEDVATLEDGIPVHRPAARGGNDRSGMVAERETRLETLVVPKDAPADTELVVRIEPSPHVPLLEAPFLPERLQVDTTDAWVSHLLPAVTSYAALARVGGLPDTEAAGMDMRRRVATVLDRIYVRQNADGGWGWWHPSSDLHLTSYVMYGLLRAEAAGFSVRPDVRAAGLGYLYATLVHNSNLEVRQSHLAFALYILSEAGTAWPQGAAARLYADRASLGIEGSGFLALALGIADPSDTRVETLLDEVGAAARTADGVAYWEASGRHDWATPCQATGVVAGVLGRLAPEVTLLPQATRWLTLNCRFSDIGAGYESAWGVTALSDYLSGLGDPPVVDDWQVRLNGVVLTGEGSKGRRMDEPMIITERLSAGSGLLQPGANVIEITRGEGEGDLFYRASLVQATATGGEARGLVLDRQYCRVDSAVMRASGEVDPCVPVDAVEVGDKVEVRLVLSVPVSREFVMVEDPYPAGFEPVPSEDSAMSATRITGFDHNDLGETSAHFYARALVAGTYELSYRLRATVPGTYRVLPGVASELYTPDIWGSSGAGTIAVQAAGD